MDQDTCKHGVITSVMEEMRFFGKTLNEDMVNACAYLLQSHQGLSDMMDLDNTYLE